MANHTATALACNTSQKSQLQRLESSGKTPQKIALRARIILKAIAGESNSAIAQALRISRPTVLLWRNRFTEAGVPAFSPMLPGRDERKLCRQKKLRL